MLGARVLPPNSPSGCSPKSTGNGRRLRAHRGAPFGVTRAAAGESMAKII